MVQRFCCCDCGKTFSQSNNNGMRVSRERIDLAMRLLCESNSIRATSRLTKLHQETVLKILKVSGTIAGQFMEEKAKNLKCSVVCADEIYSFVHTREYKIKEKCEHKGGQFTFLSVDRESKFIINTITGSRNLENATEFMTKLKERVAGRIQLNTDAWIGYRGVKGVIKRVFGFEIDHATEEKTFMKLNQFVTRDLAKVERKQRIGFPNMEMASTSFVERTNLSMRHFNRRFTRCTLAFSKKLSNHRLAVDLFVWNMNFARKHATIKTTPAIAIGLNVAKMTMLDLWNIGIGNN